MSYQYPCIFVAIHLNRALLKISGANILNYAVSTTKTKKKKKKKKENSEQTHDTYELQLQRVDRERERERERERGNILFVINFAIKFGC